MSTDSDLARPRAVARPNAPTPKCSPQRPNAPTPHVPTLRLPTPDSPTSTIASNQTVLGPDVDHFDFQVSNFRLELGVRERMPDLLDGALICLCKLGRHTQEDGQSHRGSRPLREQRRVAIQETPCASNHLACSSEANHSLQAWNALRQGEFQIRGTTPRRTNNSPTPRRTNSPRHSPPLVLAVAQWRCRGLRRYGIRAKSMRLR